jgi:hypothetical protein
MDTLHRYGFSRFQGQFDIIKPKYSFTFLVQIKSLAGYLMMYSTLQYPDTMRK